MSIHVPASFQTKYNNNVKLALQQHKSHMLAGSKRQDDASAEIVKVEDIIGNTGPNEASERHGDTKYNNPNYDGVWLPKKPELYFADIIDNADKLATSIDLEGTATMSGAGTVARAKDQRILQGFYGPIISGKSDALVTTPFPGANEVAVTVGGASSAQKMNTKKLREAKTFLGQKYNDPMLKRWCVLTAEDNDALLDEVPATSTDFQKAFGAKVDDQGNLICMLGFWFIHMELDNPLLGDVPDLATNGSGYRKTPFWVDGGLRHNFWQELRTSVDPLPQKQLSRQVWAGTTLAATRTQADMAGIILNAKG